MDLSEQIRGKFAILSRSRGDSLLLAGFPKEYSSWTLKIYDSYAVAIEIDKDIKVNESFAEINYFTGLFKIGEEEKHLLILANANEELRNEFAAICALFLELGDKARNRIALIGNPVNWWSKWKSLIGNKDVEKTPYSVLGELLVLYILLTEKQIKIDTDNWAGPQGKSVDIQTDLHNYEVKTSLIKYSSIVTVSGQFQLNPNKPLSLVYVKLEETPAKDVNSWSIDTALNKLTGLGLDRKELNKKIERLGLMENSISRRQRYNLLEVTEYPVDENFPYLNVEKITGEEKSSHILQLTYKLELAGLKNNPWPVK